MTRRFAVSLTLLLVSCGGKPAPDATTPASPGDGHADHDHTGGGDPVADAAPAEATPDPAQVKADLLAAERAAYDRAKPVFDRHCSRCHSKDSKKGKGKGKTLAHFDMTTYPFGGHHAMEVSGEVRKVLGIGGGKATMPADDPGAVQGEELALIAAWADAFDAAHAGGAHEGHKPDHGGHKH